MKKLLENFKDHEINIITNTKDVKVFYSARPKNLSFSFQLVFADNLIAMSGDIYSLMINPGKGRSLGWLRGSIGSLSYVREKMPKQFHNDRDWKSDSAKKALKEYLDQDSKDNPENEEKNNNISEYTDYNAENEHDFYDYCYKNGIEEPYYIYNGDVSNVQMLQLAALTWFCKKLDEIGFEGAKE
jgi:hypothetical protein